MFRYLGMFDRALGMFQSPGTIPFSPSQIFTAFQGAWYEPTTSTTYQENTGITPGALGSTVGLELDRSQGLVIGPEKAAIANQAASWTAYGSNTVADVSGAVTITYVGGTNAGFGAYISTSSFSLTVGAFYNLTVDAAINTGSATLYINDGLSNIYLTTLSSPSYSKKTCIFKYSGNGVIQINADLSAGEVVSLTNFSVRQILGNHATQATAANRPLLTTDSNGKVLLRSDATDYLTASLPSINVRRNLLTYSEQFDNAAWAKTASRVVANSALAPDGTATADKLVEDTSSSPHQAFQARVLTADVYTLSFYAKAGERTHVAFTFDTGGNVWGYINLSTGSIAGSMPAAYTVNSIANVGNGWYRVSVSRTATAATYYANFATANGAAVSYTGDGVSGIYIAGAQVELGSVATDYQKVTDWTSEQYSSSGSVYFSTPVGMSQLNNQSMGQTYTLPALSSDIYSWMVFPQRLNSSQENKLAQYMQQKAGIAGPDYFEQEDYGPELGGSFTLGAGWTFTSGVLTSDGTQGGASSTARTVTSAVIGTTYIISYTRNQTSGLLQVYCGSTFITTHSVGSGTSTWIVKAAVTTGALFFISTNPSAVVSISNISVRELKDGMTGYLLEDDGSEILMAQ